jgi:hypothetical protein
VSVVVDVWLGHFHARDQTTFQNEFQEGFPDWLLGRR